MSYQVCRWYDPYPRLAFALKLLYLAPASLREKATRELSQFLSQHLGLDAADAPNLQHPTGKGSRWYDASEATAQTVELLRQTPDSLKTLSAEKLLQSLEAGL